MRYIAGVLLFLGLGAAVEAQEIRGPYAGLSVGSFTYRDNGENLGAPISDSTSAYRVLGGWQFNSVYAFEAGWGRSGKFKERFDGFDPSVGNVSLEISGEYEIATLRFLAMAPLSNLNIFGGVGYYDAELDVSFRFQSPVEVQTVSGEDSDSGLTVLGGMQYEFRRFAVRGEYEWFDTDSGVDAYSLNLALIFRF
jgi:opacity protein-like surface antigen